MRYVPTSPWSAILRFLAELAGRIVDCWRRWKGRQDMAVDVAALQAALDQLKLELEEESVAKVTLQEKQTAAADANAALATATDSYTKESEDSKAKMRELISQLQAGLGDA
jgi:hypothetical protein